MTTVVALRKEKAIYADSRITTANSVFSTAKCFDIKGTILAGSGDFNAFKKFKKWLENGGHDDFLEIDGDFDALQLFPNGRLLCWDNSLNSIEVLDDFYAIGSGAIAVMTALELGHDPITALQAVSKFDVGTSGPFAMFEPREIEKPVVVEKSKVAVRRKSPSPT